MKRIVLALCFVAAFVILLGSAGFALVHYLHRRAGNHADHLITYEEMQKLEEKGEAAEKEIDRLLACFDSPDEDRRLMAALTLKSIGKKAVVPVQARLSDKNPKVRFSAIETLGWIGPNAAPAVEAIGSCLKDADAEIRFKAAYALGKIGVASEVVISGLIHLVADAEEHVVQQALDSLQALGPPAAKMVYASLANQADPRRERLLLLATKMDPPPPEALPLLTELSKDRTSQSLRGNALRLLGELGKDAVPAFQAALKKADPADDFELMAGIARLGANGKELLPELSTYLLERRFWDAEAEAMTPFKKSGTTGAAALTQLLKDLIAKMGNPLDHREAAILRTLGEVGADAKPAVPTLVTLLKEKEKYRVAILQTLGDIGPAARDDATEAVRALTKDPGSAEAARVALRRMGVVSKR